MGRFPLPCLLAVLVAGLPPSPVLAGEPLASRPNVLIIISDDHAWGDYGFMGHPHLQTPHLDRLAAQSLVFHRGYSPVPLCRPSLASIVTGLYPHQHGVTGNDPTLPDKEVNAMAARGNPKYARYYDTIIQNFRRRPNFVRDLVSRGYLGFQTGKWWEGDPVKTAGFTQAMTRGELQGSRHGDAGLEIGRKGLEPIFQFIEDARERPWLVWYAPMLPHAPHTAPEDLLEKYRQVAPTEAVARYWACVEWFDRTCGGLLDHLEKIGQRSRTIVLYTTDNGWIQDPEKPDRFAPRSKLTPYEGGVRTPILISWLGRVTPRVDKEHLASNVDLWPTLADLLDLPPPQGLPGINLTDPDAVARRTRIHGEQYTHNIADVDAPTRNLEHRWIIDGWWKLVVPEPGRYPHTQPELYHLRQDPWEQMDLAARESERVAELRQRLDDWWDPRSNEVPASAKQPLRSVRVNLPNQAANAIRTSWPAIGCWFWTAEEFVPDGYRRFLDLYERHSAFRLLTTSIRHPVEVTDPAVHDQIKAAAEYARTRDMGIVMDLDVRLARQAFQRQYPDELQEIVRLREVVLTNAGEAQLAIEPINLGDHYTFRARGYDSISARVLRVYSYVKAADGIEPDTVQDITRRCTVVQADAQGVKVTIPGTAPDSGRTACVLAAFTLFTPDVFAPHLAEFERGILRQYADLPLAGACKDEWGFPGRFGPRLDDLYYSRFMDEAYAQRRPGHDLLRDLLLMAKGESARAGQRAAAVNHYLELNWQRNGELETAFYQAVKDIFGPDAMVGTHPTWYPFPTPEEVFKNGLDWWVSRRDLAQTDEATPFSARTALAKRWRSPLWYNMYYDSSIASYEEDLWRHALGGGRLNFHPPWPRSVDELTPSLLRGRLLAADSRVRLLNYISTAPIDCPVAVVFGHPSALNWTGPGFADVGLAVANGLWAEGYYADLIPSSEIKLGNLKLASNGWLEYGPQRYAAAVLYHPQFERPAVADFFREAAAIGKTALFRVGEWTLDFEGKPCDAAALLPPAMKPAEAAAVVQQVIAHLRTTGVEPQTPSTMRAIAGFPASMMPRPTGQCRLLDGTVIIAAGEKDVLGDPIQKTITVNGCPVAFDTIGVAAVRLKPDGQLEAMAAGGLKSFRCGEVAIEMPERADVALWHDDPRRWRGVLQGWTGPVPAALTAITADWVQLAVPKSLEP